MAKSARASVKKTNNKKLKARVFGPVETARTQRLSAKLLEIVNQPRPPKAEMELEKEEADNSAAQAKAPAHQAEDMEVDDASATKPSMASLKKKTGRVQKKRRGKSASTITFPNFRTGSRQSGSGKKGKR